MTIKERPQIEKQALKKKTSRAEIYPAPTTNYSEGAELGLCLCASWGPEGREAWGVQEGRGAREVQEEKDGEFLFRHDDQGQYHSDVCPPANPPRYFLWAQKSKHFQSLLPRGKEHGPEKTQN